MTPAVAASARQSRAILLDPSRPQQRRLSRVLAGAGYEVEVVEDHSAVTPLPPPGDGSVVLYLGPPSLREPLLSAARAGCATVIYGPAEALAAADLSCPQLVGLLSSGERLELEGELLSLARHQQGLPLPPLQAYLLWGAPAYVAHIGDIHAREAVVSRVGELCQSLRAPRKVADSAAEVAHELLTNAMYTAPVGEGGEPRYAHDRAAPISLAGTDRPTFCFGSDGLRVAMEVTDRFGRLRRAHLCHSLGRAAAGQVNEGQGGAGIGLSMVARGSEVLQVDVLPAQRTRVTAVLSLEARPSGGSGPQSPGRPRHSVLLSFAGERHSAGSQA